MLKIKLKSQQRFKSDNHNVCTEQINKIALSSDDDKILQTFAKLATYPYGTNTFKACEIEMLSKFQQLFLIVMQMKTKLKSGCIFQIIHIKY